MRFSRSRSRRAAGPRCAPLLAGLLLLHAAQGTGGELSPLEELGSRVYHRGEGADGSKITATVGEAGVEVPASVLPCVGCHGRDGRGKPEGGVSPSDLTWKALTKPYGIDHPSGRKHPPYDERLLRRAITMGIDPAGTPLHISMPRYRLTHRQATALVAYLRQLGRERDPGVEDDLIRIGVVQPPPGRLPGLSEGVRRLLEAHAARVNERGGIYGRRLELEFLEAPEEPAARSRAVARFLEERRIFALTALFMAGAEAELDALIDENRVPVLGPFTVHPRTGFPLNRFIFYLLPGLSEQARVLVDFAAARIEPAPGGIVVAHPTEPALRAVAAAILEQGRKHEEATWGSIRARPYPPGQLDARSLAAEESGAGTGVLFFIGDEAETAALLREAAALEWRPHVLLLSSLAGRGAAAVPDLGDRIYLSYASLPSDRTPGALAGYLELAAEYDLPESSPAIQLAALSAAQLLTEALERAGRELDREQLIEVLEGFHDYRTGLLPPITFNANRRIGSLGAYVVPLRPTGRSPSGLWVTPR